jgi:ribonuclease HI
MDYASTVWHNPLKDKRHLKWLDTVQRSALICILSAFRTIATATMEVEIYILPTHLRLKQRAQKVIVKLCILPHSHPMHDVLSRARRRRDNVGARCRFPLAESMKTMKTEQLTGLETINPTPTTPWNAPPFVEINIKPDRDKASENATTLLASPGTVIYLDTSGQKGHLRAAAVMLNENQGVADSQQVSIASMANWSVHAAELIGIFYAVSLVLKTARLRPTDETTPEHKTRTILCDNMSALQAIKNPHNNSRQQIIYAILQAASELKAQGIPLRLQWIPGHSNNPGNNAADSLAK